MSTITTRGARREFICDSCHSKVFRYETVRGLPDLCLGCAFIASLPKDQQTSARHQFHGLGIIGSHQTLYEIGGAPLDYSCPFCQTVSHNRNDIDQRYCGKCKQFALDVVNEMEMLVLATDGSASVRIRDTLFGALVGLEATLAIAPVGDCVQSPVGSGAIMWWVSAARLECAARAYRAAFGPFEGKPLPQRISGIPKHAIIMLQENTELGGFMLHPGQYRVTRLS